MTLAFLMIMLGQPAATAGSKAQDVKGLPE
jgi:hypothetical protein